MIIKCDRLFKREMMYFTSGQYLDNNISMSSSCLTFSFPFTIIDIYKNIYHNGNLFEIVELK